jgi:hypothetical protein
MRKHLFLIDKGSCGLGIDLARWPDFLGPILRSSRGLRSSASFGRLKHARRPARRIPEILEERFARAKSGLMLAPANTQAVFAISSEILAYNKVNKFEFSGKEDV